MNDRLFVVLVAVAFAVCLVVVSQGALKAQEAQQVGRYQCVIGTPTDGQMPYNVIVCDTATCEVWVVMRGAQPGELEWKSAGSPVQ